MGSVTGEKNDKVSKLDGDAPESTDFANYFCTYAYLYHQVSYYFISISQFKPTLSIIITNTTKFQF